MVKFLESEVEAAKRRIEQRRVESTKQHRLEWDLIVLWTAEEFGTEPEAIHVKAKGRGKRGPENVADARQVSTFLIRENYPLTTDDVVAAFIGCTRTNVIHATRSAKDKCEGDANFRAKVLRIDEKILAITRKIGQAEVADSYSPSVPSSHKSQRNLFSGGNKEQGPKTDRKSVV